MAADLFGNPIDPGFGRRGRPRHMPNAQLRQWVRAMRAEGMSQPAIARAVGITEPTLRLNYHEELQSTSRAWRRRAEREGKHGNDE